MKKILLASSMALALLAGCSTDTDEAQMASDSTLKVTASINEVKTRASDTSWDTNDLIGVSGGDYVNIQYVTTAGDGSFTAVTEANAITSTDEMSVSAYYPFTGTENTTAGTIDISVVDTDNAYLSASEKNFDYMFAEAVTTSNLVASLKFEHKMSKLVFTITDETTTEDGSISLTLSNIAVSGTFSTEEGTVTAGDATGTVTTSGTEGSAISLILPSYSTASSNVVSLTLTSNGKNYTTTFTPALVASTQYSYTIAISAEEETTETAVTVSSESISGWTDTTNEDLTVEESVTVPTNETLEVGDFLLSDGSTLDKNDYASLPSSLSVVGVVYYAGDPTAQDAALKNDFPACTNGLAIALNNANSEGARFGTITRGAAMYTYYAVLSETYSYYTNSQISSGDNTPSTTAYLGYNNTQLGVLGTAADDGTDSSILYAETCSYMIENLNSYSAAVAAPTGTSGWFLPSWPELDLIRQNLSTIQTSLTAAGGSLSAYDTFTNSAPSGLFYWSSTERAASLLWVSPLSDTVSAIEYSETNEEGVQQASRNSGSAVGWYRFAIAF